MAYSKINKKTYKYSKGNYIVLYKDIYDAKVTNEIGCAFIKINSILHDCTFLSYHIYCNDNSFQFATPYSYYNQGEFDGGRLNSALKIWLDRECDIYKVETKEDIDMLYNNYIMLRELNK